MKIAELLERRGVSVPCRTVQRYVAEVLGRTRGRGLTVRVADGEPGEELQVDFCRMGLIFDPAAGRDRVATVSPDLHPVADQPAGRIDVDGARRRLATPDAAELSQLPAAERVAVLLAAAGAEIAEAIATMQQLGIPDGDIHDALTAVVPYETVERAAEPP